MGKNGAQANNNNNSPPPHTLYNMNTATSPPTENTAEKKERRAAERARRKVNKKSRKNDTLICCSPNYNTAAAVAKKWRKLHDRCNDRRSALYSVRRDVDRTKTWNDGMQEKYLSASERSKRSRQTRRRKAISSC
jgi:hypothetical protein